MSTKKNKQKKQKKQQKTTVEDMEPADFVIANTQTKRIEKIMKFKLPDENDSMEYWAEFIEAENTPVSMKEINSYKRMIDLTDISIKNEKYSLEQKKKIVRFKCEKVYILANLELRRERQLKMKSIMDKMGF